MNRILDFNDTININGRSYTITGLAGFGASCIVYKATASDGTTHLLKEYNPRKYDLTREDNGMLCLDTSDEEIINGYSNGLNRFCGGAEKQIRLRTEITELMNQTSNAEEFVMANGTAYIIMSISHGVVYSEYKEKHIHDLIKRMKTLAEVIGYYHNNGYLHLDIKPDNIFIFPETCELIQLFDFDSVVRKEDLFTHGISYTNTWAAPEQLCPSSYKNISERTDIFAIGEILFYQLFNRHSVRQERRTFSVFDFKECRQSLFENTNPQVYALLTDFFRKTICVNHNQRFSSVEELVTILNLLIDESNPQKPFLRKIEPITQEYFVGRECEINEIDERLDKEKVLFIRGIGGIGKTEIALNYAKKHAKKYDYILHITYCGSWIESISNDANLPIGNIGRVKQEPADDYSKRKIDALRQILTENSLIIIDNVDIEAFKNKNDIASMVLSLPGRFIFTTRDSISGYSNYELGPLKKSADLKSIFCFWYKSPINSFDEAAILNIIEILDYHTLAIELVAKQTFEGFSTPLEKLDKIKKYGIEEDSTDVTRRQGNVLLVKTPFDHISDIFQMNNLSIDAVNFLFNMTFAPVNGVNATRFLEMCNIKDFHLLSELVRKGWIQREDTSFTIRLHPVIAEVVRKRAIITDDCCDALYSYLQSQIINWQDATFSDRSTADLFAASFSDWIYYKKVVQYYDIYISDYWLYNRIFTGKEIIHRLESILESECKDVLVDNNKKAELCLLLADAYYEICNLEKMNEYTKRAKSFNLGMNEVVEARINTNFGLYIAEKEGNYSNAMKYYNFALANINKEDYISFYLNILLNIAQLQTDFSLFDESLDTCLSVLEWLQKKNKTKVAGISDIYTCIGNNYMEKGCYDSALLYYYKMKEIAEEYYGDKNPETARANYAISCCLAKQGNTADAMEILKSIHDIYALYFGEESDRMANYYGVAGGICDQTLNPIEALKNYQKSAEIYKRLGNNTPERLITLHNVASTQIELEQYDDATHTILESETIYWNYYSDENTSPYATIMYDKAGLYKRTGQYPQAIEALLKAKGILLNLFDKTHPMIEIIEESLKDITFKQ